MGRLHGPALSLIQSRRLSDLTPPYCGKAPLSGGGHLCCSFLLNSSLFAGQPAASKDQQNSLKPGFRSRRTVKPDSFLAAGQQLAATLYRSAYLIRRGAADMVAGVDRAFQGQHGEHVLLDLLAELAQ